MTYKVYLSSRAERDLKGVHGRVYLRLQEDIRIIEGHNEQKASPKED